MTRTLSPLVQPSTHTMRRGQIFGLAIAAIAVVVVVVVVAVVTASAVIECVVVSVEADGTGDLVAVVTIVCTWLLNDTDDTNTNIMN